ncbi:MAG TPA: glycoside hydrolase family 36 protein [Gaiellaceae bacterium]|jgi:alpha-galactosidase
MRVIYAEGWQSWTPPTREGDGHGLVVVAEEDGVRAHFLGDELWAPDLESALAAVGDRLSPGPLRRIPPGWCSWSQYFSHVTAANVIENVEAALELELPIEIVQVDDGWEAGIGDWLDVSPRFGSLPDVVARIDAAGMTPGIWLAPFLVGEKSGLASAHPDWIVPGADAGRNWGQALGVLDVSKAAEHLANVFRTLVEQGFGYFKLDFLFAGALPGVEHYREGLHVIREAVGPEPILLGCGAPIFPSVGFFDAMRIGPDVLPELPDEEPDIAHVIGSTAARAWMNGRLWVNDPDTLVARPEIAEREAWAAHLEGYGGVAFSSDRLAALDERGLALTRRVLSSPQARR